MLNDKQREIRTSETLCQSFQEYLRSRPHYDEPSREDITNQLTEFVQSGLSGLISNRPWSQRNGEIQLHYVRKFLRLIAQDVESPLLPGVIQLAIYSNNMSDSEKLNTYNAVVAFSKYLVILNRLPPARLEEIRKLRPKRHTPVKKTYITEEEKNQIIDYVFNNKQIDTFSRYQFKTVIEVAYETGLRISEIVNLKLSDINFKVQEILIRKAKGNKSYKKGFNNRLRKVLKEYIQRRPLSENLNLFILGNGKSLSKDTFIQRFRRVSKKLGLDTSLHAFRRNYITRHLQDGKSLVDVSLAVGHSSPRMTEQYLLPDVQRSIEEQKQW